MLGCPREAVKMLAMVLPVIWAPSRGSHHAERGLGIVLAWSTLRIRRTPADKSQIVCRQTDNQLLRKGDWRNGNLGP